MSATVKKTRGKRSTRNPITRGTQPQQARNNAGRFSRENQPARRGRPRGSRNVFSRLVKEAVIEAANRIGIDGQGTDGMVGYMEHLGRNNESVFGGLLRGVMGQQVSVERVEQPKEYPTEAEVLAELKRFGIVPMDRKELPFYHGPEIELDAEDVADGGNDETR